MNRVLAGVLLGTMIVLPSRSVAGAERSTDGQIKQVIQGIDRAFDAWKDELERRNMDDAVIRSASGTIDVRKFLKDFENDIDVLKDRFKPGYAAVPEVLPLLRRASDVERRNQQQGGTSSEWKSLSSLLGQLAAAYHMTWPVDSAEAQPRRLNDGELASRVRQVEDAAKRLKGDVDKSGKALAKADRDALKRDLDQLARESSAVRKRLQDGKPASSEVERIASLTSSLGDRVGALPLSPPGRTAWSSITGGVEVLSSEFAIPQGGQ